MDRFKVIKYLINLNTSQNHRISSSTQNQQIQLIRPIPLRPKLENHKLYPISKNNHIIISSKNSAFRKIKTSKKNKK